MKQGGPYEIALNSPCHIAWWNFETTEGGGWAPKSAPPAPGPTHQPLPLMREAVNFPKPDAVPAAVTTIPYPNGVFTINLYTQMRTKKGIMHLT
jgi:hypothetical protein